MKFPFCFQGAEAQSKVMHSFAVTISWWLSLFHLHPKEILIYPGKAYKLILRYKPALGALTHHQHTEALPEVNN